MVVSGIIPFGVIALKNELFFEIVNWGFGKDFWIVGGVRKRDLAKIGVGKKWCLF